LSTAKGDVPEVTKSREHSSFSSAILPKHLKTRVPTRPHTPVLSKAQVPGFWLPAMLHSNWNIRPKFFQQRNSIHQQATAL